MLQITYSLSNIPHKHGSKNRPIRIGIGRH